MPHHTPCFNTWVEASLAPVPMQSWSGHLCLTRDSQAPLEASSWGYVCIFPHPQSVPTCPFLTLACPGPPQVSSPTLMTRTPLLPTQNPRPEGVWQLPPVPRAPFAEGGGGLALPSWMQPRRSLIWGAGQWGDQGALHLDPDCPSAHHLSRCPWGPSCGREPCPHPCLACASEALSLP